MKINVHHNFKNSATFTPSVVTKLLSRRYLPTDKDATHAVAFLSDVQLLTTQQKLLHRLDSEAQSQYLAQMTPTSSVGSDIRNKASKSDLIRTCKSRYCQDIGDLFAWHEYLTELGKTEVAHAKEAAAAAAIKQEQESLTTNSE